MKKQHITVILVIICALTATWLWGGRFSPSQPPIADMGTEPANSTEVSDEVYAAQVKEAEVVRQAELEALGQNLCTLSVRCDTILDNMELLAADKQELVPADGALFATRSVEFSAGETVFDLLLREMKLAKIHLEFMNVPLYDSAYIEGIGNLYEFDVGELSGWMYKVNGWFPNYGCSRYQLQAGDVVEWLYTCELGYDIGGGGMWGQS
jgi:hypothetical protein